VELKLVKSVVEQQKTAYIDMLAGKRKCWLAAEWASKPLMKDLERAEVFNTTFATAFTDKAYSDASQVFMPCGSVRGVAVLTRAG